MAKHTTMFNGKMYDFEFISKVFKEAKEEVYQELYLELEGLQSILEHCPDEKTSTRLSKRLNRIK